MKRMQSLIVLAVLVLAVFAGVCVGTWQPEPAMVSDPYTTLQQATPQVPVGVWRY